MDGVLRDPAAVVDDDHRCDAIDGPRLISPQQQRFVCLRSAHLDCPRYRRAVATPPVARGPIHVPAVPRAIAASLIVLALSAGISLGFVMARGGIDLPAAALSSGAAAAASAPGGPGASGASPASSAGATPSVPGASPSAASAAPSSAPPATEPPSPSPTTAPSPTPEATPTSAPTQAPVASPAASGGPSASRLAVLTPCPGKAGCYVYAIRQGDNLFSIAHWFGVPLDTIYAWNPTVKAGIHVGMSIQIPTPTR